MEPLLAVTIAWGIELGVTFTLLSWCRFCDRKYSKRTK